METLRFIVSLQTFCIHSTFSRPKLAMHLLNLFASNLSALRSGCKAFVTRPFFVEGTVFTDIANNLPDCCKAQG